MQTTILMQLYMGTLQNKKQPHIKGRPLRSLKPVHLFTSARCGYLNTDQQGCLPTIPPFFERRAFKLSPCITHKRFETGLSRLWK